MRIPLAVVLFLLACGESTPEPAPPASAESAMAESAAEATEPAATEPAATEPETQPPPSAMNDAAAQTLLNTWLSAQNEGDFERYSSLFAERFEGVKRADEREYHFARAAWLENRARMFQRPMTVTASEVSVRSTATTATIRFVQRWSSATFQDVGPKEIVVVIEDGELRIAREEMLGSRRELPELANDTFMLALRHTQLYAVLVAQTDEAGMGAPTLLPREGEPVVAWRESREREDEGVEGREVRVFTAAGTHCDGTLGPPRVMRRVIPHFGTVQAWNGEEGAAYSDAQIAADIWTMGADTTLRVAEVRGCSDGLWVAARSATPQFYSATEGGAAEGRNDAVDRAFQGLRAWRDLQAMWSGEYEGQGRWDAAPGPPPTEFQTWTHGARRVVTVEGRGGSGCAEFYGRLSGIFDLEGTRAVSRSGDVTSTSIDFLSVVDIDADGSPEIVVKDGLLRRNAAGDYERVVDVTPPMLDCDC